LFPVSRFFREVQLTFDLVWGQTLAASGRQQVLATRELCAEWAQLEMQLVVARVAAAVAVASDASTRTTLEAAK
jgi:hypothetical protein